MGKKVDLSVQIQVLRDTAAQIKRVQENPTIAVNLMPSWEEILESLADSLEIKEELLEKKFLDNY